MDVCAGPQVIVDVHLFDQEKLFKKRIKEAVYIHSE